MYLGIEPDRKQVLVDIQAQMDGQGIVNPESFDHALVAKAVCNFISTDVSVAVATAGCTLVTSMCLHCAGGVAPHAKEYLKAILGRLREKKLTTVKYCSTAAFSVFLVAKMDDVYPPFNASLRSKNPAVRIETMGLLARLWAGAEAIGEQWVGYKPLTPVYMRRLVTGGALSEVTKPKLVARIVSDLSAQAADAAEIIRTAAIQCITSLGMTGHVPDEQLLEGLDKRIRAKVEAALAKRERADQGGEAPEAKEAKDTKGEKEERERAKPKGRPRATSIGGRSKAPEREAAAEEEDPYGRPDVSDKLGLESPVIVKLAHPDWHMRLEAIKEVQALFAQHNYSVQPRLGELPGVLVNRYKAEKNAKLAPPLMAMTADALRSLRPVERTRYVQILAMPVIQGLADSKAGYLNTVERVLTLLTGSEEDMGNVLLDGAVQSGHRNLFHIIASGLSAKKSRVHTKAQCYLLSWIAGQFVQYKDEETPRPDHKRIELMRSLIEPVMHHLNDPNPGPRRDAESLLASIIHVDPTHSVKRVKECHENMTKASRDKIQPLVNRLCEAERQRERERERERQAAEVKREPESTAEAERKPERKSHPGRTHKRSVSEVDVAEELEREREAEAEAAKPSRLPTKGKGLVRRDARGRPITQGEEVEVETEPTASHFVDPSRHQKERVGKTHRSPVRGVHPKAKGKAEREREREREEVEPPVVTPITQQPEAEAEAEAEFDDHLGDLPPTPKLPIPSYKVEDVQDKAEVERAERREAELQGIRTQIAQLPATPKLAQLDTRSLTHCTDSLDALVNRLMSNECRTWYDDALEEADAVEGIISILKHVVTAIREKPALLKDSDFPPRLVSGVLRALRIHTPVTAKFPVRLVRYGAIALAEVFERPQACGFFSASEIRIMLFEVFSLMHWVGTKPEELSSGDYGTEAQLRDAMGLLNNIILETTDNCDPTVCFEALQSLLRSVNSQLFLNPFPTLPEASAHPAMCRSAVLWYNPRSLADIQVCVYVYI
ncbi:hypothetical protein KIPB_006566 [Kipferlia bialata]|uniref:TOG domain-containing protein n=2 Tax=Kipferlia bialata TaxID=797122 RepID=A0A9K3CYQ6_9EUKA|nr:hypothetical protein KIPB_006566 [Kipferlia bialata]|eukprot:g6566.t1